MLLIAACARPLCLAALFGTQKQLKICLVTPGIAKNRLQNAAGRLFWPVFEHQIGLQPNTDVRKQLLKA
jgi:hypothetical protein